MFSETPHFPVPAKAEIRAPALDRNLTNQHAPAVPNVDAVPAPAVHVPKHIALDPVRRTVVRVSEQPAAGQIGLGVVFPEHRKGVDGRGALGVGAAVTVNEVRVGNVDDFLGWGKADAVWSAEAVRHDADIARFRDEAVDVLRELWFGPEALLVAVDGVGEPDGAVRMDDDVVGGVEGARVEIVEDGGGFVGAFGFHVDQPGWFFQAALCAEDEAFAVVCAAIGHEVALRTTDFVACKVCG